MSEWLKVMLEEVERKRAESRQAQLEDQMRDDERKRSTPTSAGQHDAKA